MLVSFSGPGDLGFRVAAFRYANNIQDHDTLGQH